MATQDEHNEEQNLTTADDSFDVMAKLSPQHQRFVHLYMTGQYSLNKLAQLLEFHPNTLQKWLRRSDVKLAIDEMQRTTHTMVQTQLKALTLQAINRLGELTNSPIDGVSLQAVKDILDRAGHKQKTEIKVDKTVTTVEEKMKQLIDESIDVEHETISEE